MQYLTQNSVIKAGCKSNKWRLASGFLNSIDNISISRSLLLALLIRFSWYFRAEIVQIQFLKN